MDSGGIDFRQVMNGILQAVPVWGIVLGALQYWLHRQKKFQEAEEARWSRIESRIYNIEISLASSGIVDLKKTVDDMKAAHISQELNIKALWRTIDPPKRTSDVD